MTEHLLTASGKQSVDYGSTTSSVVPELGSEPEGKSSQVEARLPSFMLVAEYPSNYSRMSMDTMPNSESRQIVQRLEFTLNVLNQICIGFVTIYMCWLTLRTGLAGTSLHAFLVTIGFSFFMAQGIMVHYGGNVLTHSYRRSTKTTIHWMLMVLGGGCGAAGALIKMIQKGFLLQSTHGKLGMTAFVLCLLAMASGLSALCSNRIKQLITPLLNKTFHNFLGIAAFTIALVTQYYGYETGYFTSKVALADFRILMKCLTLISLVLTLFGPLKALYNKFRNIARHFS